jgi:pimeloyl-ACP methyl ester carboxylesterase
MRSHVEAVPATVLEMQNAEPIRNIPVLVLTPGDSAPLSDEQLARIGNSVQQVIAQARAHWVHLDQPDLVVDSIREMAIAASAEPLPVTA